MIERGPGLETLMSRADVLEVLTDGPLAKRDVIDRLGVSRSTVDRAIRALEEAALIERVGGGYVANAGGRVALARYREFVDEMATVFDATAVLGGLDPTVEVDPRIATGAEAIPATDPAPYRPAERLHEAISGADRYHAVLPTVEDSRHLRLLYEHVVVEGGTAELVTAPSVLSVLDEEFPRRFATMAETDRFDLYRLPDLDGDSDRSGLPYGLVLTEREAAGRTAWLLVFADHGGLHGVLRNDTRAAASWADRECRRHRERARRVTDRFETTTAHETAFPRTLTREGFVRLGPSYFVDTPVDPPAVAWQTGLGLPEVHAGYAVERSAGELEDGAEASLVEHVLGRLREGENVALVGPPGSGKSTVCKGVACEWYRAGTGPVFYRESGTEPFESVDALVEAVRSASGTPLVVVEDAVRPEAVRIAAALDRLGRPGADSESELESVSESESESKSETDRQLVVLVDARSEEWHDPDAAAADDASRLRAAVDPVRVPPLSERDRERFVDRFERTVGATLPDRLAPLDDDRPGGDDRGTADGDQAGTDAGTAGGGLPDRPFLLVHRLARFAERGDPPQGTDGPEPDWMTAECDAVFDELVAIGERALAAGVLVNLLNVAGVDADPGHVRAVAGGDADGTMAVLRDRVFLEGGDGGTLRTVHPVWSQEFLSHVADRAPERVAAAADRGLDALVALAEDPTARVEVRDRRTGDWLDRVAEAPTEWTDRLFERVFGTVETVPKLAPVLGTDPDGEEGGDDPEPGGGSGPGGRGGVDLPERLSPGAELECRRARAAALVEGGALGHAAAGFRRLDERVAELEDAGTADGGGVDLARYRFMAEKGLGDVARHRNELDTAEDHFREALSLAEAAGNDRWIGQAHNGLGVVAGQRGDFATAEERFEAALEHLRRTDDRVAESHTLRDLGNVALGRAEYDAAVDYYEESIALARRHGLFPVLAGRYQSLGDARLEQGDLDEAEEAYRRALGLARRVGVPLIRNAATAALGELALVRGDLDEAERRLELALERFEAMGRPRWIARSKKTLGRVARRRGEIEESDRLLRDVLGLVEEIGDDRMRAELAAERGHTALERGDFEDAAALFRESLRIRETAGLGRDRSGAVRGLGSVACERGEYATAEERAEEALSIARAAGSPSEEAEALTLLGRIASGRGDHERAREHLEAAVEAFRTLGDSRRTLAAIDRLVGVCAALDEPAAVEWVETGLDLADEAGLEERRSRFDDWRDRVAGGSGPASED